MTREASLITVALAVLSASSPFGLGREVPSTMTITTSPYDCGTLAIYALTRAENRQVSLADIARALPAQRAQGYSMKELKNAAAEFDCPLRGVLLRADWKLDRPAIVFLNEQGHGHFVVIRPVGESAKLVQVLELRETPYILDMSDLRASPSWTGLALIPERPNWPAWIAAGVAALSAGALAWMFIAKRFRKQFARPKP